MFLFYSKNIVADSIILEGDEHQHCVKVLRKKIGDQIFITDGKGQIYTCTIAETQKLNTTCNIQGTKTQEAPSPHLAIAIAPTKNSARIEWFVEKAIEIGINAIYFVHTHRTEKKSINDQRMEKICVSAMKQSMNVHLPTTRTFKNLKELVIALENQYQQKYIAHCDGPTIELKEIFHTKSDAILLIGPEGDFTPEEITETKKFGFTSVALGPSRLRTETAGLVGLMMMKY